MSFGRNPHVSKAELAEQKARAARDTTACALAWREAARLWERAADREADDKRKRQYVARAEIARANADAPQLEVDPADLLELDEPGDSVVVHEAALDPMPTVAVVPGAKSSLLN
jgi:hypothetical protein